MSSSCIYPLTETSPQPAKPEFAYAGLGSYDYVEQHATSFAGDIKGTNAEGGDEKKNILGRSTRCINYVKFRQSKKGNKN